MGKAGRNLSNSQIPTESPRHRRYGVFARQLEPKGIKLRILQCEVDMPKTEPPNFSSQFLQVDWPPLDVLGRGGGRPILMLVVDTVSRMVVAYKVTQDRAGDRACGTS